jgi:hypothetical protein
MDVELIEFKPRFVIVVGGFDGVKAVWVEIVEKLRSKCGKVCKFGGLFRGCDPDKVFPLRLLMVVSDDGASDVVLSPNFDNLVVNDDVVVVLSNFTVFLETFVGLFFKCWLFLGAFGARVVTAGAWRCMSMEEIMIYS